MANFNDNDKKESNFGKYFGFGVHKVKILGFNLCGTEEGEKEYVEVGFTDEEGVKEGAVRLYMNTEGNKPITFDTLRGIYIHNAPEDKKEEAKAKFNAVADSAAMVKILESKLIGGEMWYTKYYDAKGATYISDRDGRSYRSIRENVMGYETKLKTDLMPAPKESANQAAAAVFGDNTDEPFPSSNAPKGEGEGWA